ncbi:MAG: gliding motility-associated C-terminal domain-containing protein [Flavobacterium sp.]|nr:gliding motility-associated C-terminal domain-containing protein [Flavobacterium sp.]
MTRNFFLLLWLCVSIQLSGQNKLGASSDLFGQRVFVKNNGQFDGILPGGKAVDYAYSNGDEQVYFNKTGVTYLLQKRYPMTHAQMEAREHGEKIKVKPPKKAFVDVSWENSNANVEIIFSDKQSYYQSYGDEKLKSDCYKKITYKNIYDNIDIEYAFSDERTNGIKYTILVRPGGNVNDVKIKYAGDIKKVKIVNGNVVIKTAVRNITELAPISYQNGISIVSNFKTENNTISFELPNSYDKTKDLIIDPWVINLVMPGNNYGYDVDFDYAGNYYVYGGSGPFLISKYTADGVLSWTFNGIVPSVNWTSNGSYSYPIAANFIVDKVSGKCYTGQGFNDQGTRIVRINSLGIYDNLISTANYLWNEVFDMGYRCSDGTIFGLGGSTASSNSAGVLNTTTGAIAPQNFSGIINSSALGQDIACFTIDSNGVVFFVFASANPNLGLNNKLMKANTNFNGNVWLAPTGFQTLFECQNKTYPGSNLPEYNSNGFNALAVNNEFLYFYDGYNLAAYNKSNGATIAATTLTGQTVKHQGGIAVDECNNLYVGGNGFIQCFHFDGTAFTPTGSIPLESTTTLKYVTDIKFKEGSSELYVSGSGFGGIYSAINSGTCSSATIAISQTQVDINNTTAQATITTALVAPVISYTWLNSSNVIVSQTDNSTLLTNTVTNLPNGTYSLVAQFNAPCGFTTTQTFVISAVTITPIFTQVGAVCRGGLLAALLTTSNNGIIGSWAPALDNTTTTTYTFTPNPGQDATTATMTITVNAVVAPTFTPVSPICSGSFLANLPTTSTNTITGTWLPAINNTQTTLYTFTPAVGQCATPAQMTIQVNQPIAPTFTQVAAICIGGLLSNLPTTSTNAFTGTWLPALNNTQTTLYTFTPTVGQCATTAQMTIQVNQPIAPTFTQVGAVCSGALLTNLPTTSTNAFTGTWLPVPNNTQTTLYTFTPTVGQCATTAQMTIQVNQPIAPTFTQVGAICSGALLSNLPTTSTNALTGTWLPVPNNTETTLYTFTPTVGQCATSTQMTIQVDQPIVPTFTQILPICAESFLVNLPTTSTNAYQGTWSPAPNNTQTTSYTFTPVLGQCATTTQMTIVVNPIRIPTFAPISAFCYQGSAPTLPPTDSNGLLGTWQPTVVSNTTSGNYVFTPDSGQCTNTNFTMPITVFDDFDFEFKQACVGDDFVLQVVPLVNSFDLTQANFNWKNSSSSTVGTNSPTFNVTNYFSSNSILPQFPLSFTVDVTQTNGCTKSHDVSLISIYCSIQKGISPNDDDKNEFFDLQLLDVKKLEIFNRYGTKVYSKANYINEWVGQCDDGGTLPDGVYYYVIEFNANRSTKVGWIYLTR